MQNRVNPFGEIIETKARGLWMGNRGNIHNESRKIVRAFKLKAWITCKLEFKGRKRKIMMPNLYTELFFLDEGTAFAAGHRPCFECRRENAEKFKAAWLKGNPEYKFTDKTLIRDIDEIIHQQRIDKNRLKKRTKRLMINFPMAFLLLLIKSLTWFIKNTCIYGRHLAIQNANRLNRAVLQSCLPPNLL
jgi:hypothetical protein